MPTPSQPRVVLFLRSNREGVARLPRALQKAGLHVTVIAPPDSFPALTQHRDAFFPAPDGRSPLSRWVALLVFLWRLQQLPPAQIIAGDEAALRYLGRLNEPRRRLPLALLFPAAFRAITASLPNKVSFVSMYSRRQNAALADQYGLAVPAWAPCEDAARVAALVAQHGFPVIVKRDGSCAGLGVTVCHDASALAANLAAGIRPGIVQAYHQGAIAMQAGVALGGQLLSTCGWLKETCFPEPHGPSAIVVQQRDAVMEAAAQRYAEATGFTGFFSLDFVLTAGGPLLIEANPRPTPVGHLGELAHTFAAALGAPVAPAPAPAPERIAIFPQELRRDPASARDGALRHDIPWDDAPLLDALCRAHFGGVLPVSAEFAKAGQADCERRCGK
ncbi:MAG: hypothetical protein Q8M02_12130 [Candidatus Didemnitutus sp.]|nr:hypothetical protein [Candidatus Didemnitutus sp.]